MAPEEEEEEEKSQNGHRTNGKATVGMQNKLSQEKIGRIGFLDIIRVLGGVLLLNSVLSYFITGDSVLWGYRPWWTRPGPVRTFWVCFLTAFSALPTLLFLLPLLNSPM